MRFAALVSLVAIDTSPPLCPVYRLVLLGLDFCYVTADSVGMPRDVAVSSLIRLGQDIVPAVATR